MKFMKMKFMKMFPSSRYATEEDYNHAIQSAPISVFVLALGALFFMYRALTGNGTANWFWFGLAIIGMIVWVVMPYVVQRRILRQKPKDLD